MNEVHEVEGYAMCVNGSHAWVHREVASRTGGQCGECFTKIGHLRAVEVVGRGRRTQIRVKPASKPRAMTESRRQARKLSEKAKDRARKRLAAVFTDAYDIILAEERAALGLEPWPLEIALRGSPGNDEAFARLVHELDKVGADTR